MAACMTSAAAAVSRTAVKSLKQRATFGTAVKPLRAATPVTATRRAFATTASAAGTATGYGILVFSRYSIFINYRYGV